MVLSLLRLEAATWHREDEQVVACFPLSKRNSHLEWS
jgi:hypothetical protein